MTTTLERSLSRTSSASMPPLSPMISFRHEPSTPSTESPLNHLHERLSVVDSRLLELRSTVLTKDNYVDKRNREDEHIRREFQANRSISNRIDLNVVALRTDVDQLKSGVLQLKSSLGQIGNDTAFIRSDVDRISKNVDQIQADLEHIQTDVCGCRMEISKLHTTISQLRTDLITMQHETSRHLKSVFERISVMDLRMKHADRVRFNSLVHTIHAPISPVPVVDDDGTLRWPDYFPKTVWRFWCLKKRSRQHRLVQLADFYQLGGYESWGRMHQGDAIFCDTDSSDSSDCASNLTRAEAVRMYPEAAHQALAATLGLIYYKIRNEVGDNPMSTVQRPPKRQQEDVSVSSSSKQKPVKMPRRPTQISPSDLHRLINGGPSHESKSLISEESDKVGWNANANTNSEVSDDAISKLRGLVSEEVGTILRALERGKLNMRSGRSERLGRSPRRSRSRSCSRHEKAPAVQGPEQATVASTVPTEIISFSSRREREMQNVEEATIPDTASVSDTTSVST